MLKNDFFIKSMTRLLNFVDFELQYIYPVILKIYTYDKQRGGDK